MPNRQRVINAAFEIGDECDEGTQAQYMPLEQARADFPEQPSVVVLPVPEPYAQRFVAARQIEKSLPDAIGAYVEWLVRKSGWTVTERRQSDVRVPLEARHICILFRRFLSYGEDITRQYVEALRRVASGICCWGKAFNDREEIETLRARVDGHRVARRPALGVLRRCAAPCSHGDEELLEYHHTAGRFQPFRIPETLPNGLEPIRDALTMLASLHKQRNRVRG